MLMKKRVPKHLLLDVVDRVSNEKLPVENDLGPECFTPEEWRNTIALAREADPYVPIKRFTTDFVMRKACGDCRLAYQSLESWHGRCHPPAGAMTPLLRAEAGINDLAEGL